MSATENEDNCLTELEPLIPGTTINDNFKRIVLKYCAQFLGGTWVNLTIDDINLIYLEGGLTNYLYVCEIADSVSLLEENERRKVVFRIYGEIVTNLTKFNEGIIFNIMSERGIGPKLLGSFPSGRIEEYIPSTQISFEDLKCGKYSVDIAKLLCSYHMFEIPLTKDPSSHLSKIPMWLQFYENKIKKSCDIKKYTPYELECIQKINKMNLHHEYSWLKSFLNSTYSPVVFCHNDLHDGNLMLTAHIDKFDSDVCFIDFEYSSYHYRGFDVGNHFCEHVYDSFAANEDGFDFDLSTYPSREAQLKFAKAYLQRCEELTKSYPKNTKAKYLTTPELFLEECNRYSLASHMYWGLWGLVQFKVSKIKWSYMKYAIARLDGYFHFKNLFGFK